MTRATTDPRPDVSVVVVNFRSATLTLRALECCAAAAPGLVLEEIVVEGGSGPAELATLEHGRPQALVVALRENRGFAAGTNAGIARASGRHLLLLNPDAFAHDAAVATLVTHLDATPGVGVVAPALVFADGRHQDNAHRRFPNLVTLFFECCAPAAVVARRAGLHPYTERRSALRAPRPIAHATGAVLAVRAEAAAAAGPLDEDYFLYLEETDWQRRIAAAGWRIDAVPGAVFTHLGGGSSTWAPVSSPHFLDSVERYYPHPRAALATMGLAALIALGVLVPTRAVAPAGGRVDAQIASMRLLLSRVLPRLRRPAALPT